MQSALFRWSLCCGFGVTVAVVAAVMMPMFPKQGAGYPPGFGDPIFAFEMATTPEDLVLVFGASDDPERPSRLAAMDRGNRWDYAFMVAYGAFLCFFFLAVWKSTGHGVWLIPAMLAVVAAVSDAVENVILLRLTQDIEAAPGLEWLCYPVWTKFIALMFCGIAAGVHLIAANHFAWKLSGVVMVVGSLTIAAAFVDPSRWGWLVGQGLGCVWVLQLVHAAVQVRHHRRMMTARQSE